MITPEGTPSSPARREKTKISEPLAGDSQPSWPAQQESNDRGGKQRNRTKFFLSIFTLLTLSVALGGVWQRLVEGERRLLAFQSQLDTLARTTREVSVADISAYDQRLSQLEEALPPLNQRLEETRRQLNSRYTDLKKQIVSSDHKIESLQKRLNSLIPEATLVGGKVIPPIPPDLAELFAETILLKATALSGAPLKESLDHLFLLAKNNQEIADILAPLSSLEIKSLLPLSRLEEAFKHLAPKLAEAMRPPPPQDLWSAVLHQIKSLISIRRLGEAAKASPIDFKMNSLEASLQNGNMEAVLTLIQTLPMQGQRVLVSWTQHVKNHYTLFKVLKALDLYLLRRLRLEQPLYPPAGKGV